MKEELREVNKILGNKKKFRRALTVIMLVLLLIFYGLYSGEISRITAGIFGHSTEEK